MKPLAAFLLQGRTTAPSPIPARTSSALKCRAMTDSDREVLRLTSTREGEGALRDARPSQLTLPSDGDGRGAYSPLIEHTK